MIDLETDCVSRNYVSEERRHTALSSTRAASSGCSFRYTLKASVNVFAASAYH